MGEDRHYDSFGRGMAVLPLPRRKRARRWRRVLAWAAGILGAMALLTAVAVGSVALYDWMTGRQVSLTGRKVTFARCGPTGKTPFPCRKFLKNAAAGWRKSP